MTAGPGAKGLSPSGPGSAKHGGRAPPQAGSSGTARAPARYGATTMAAPVTSTPIHPRSMTFFM